MPRSAEHRFWEAIDRTIEQLDRLPPADPELLAAFFPRDGRWWGTGV
jgi:hypothetical protein